MLALAGLVIMAAVGLVTTPANASSSYYRYAIGTIDSGNGAQVGFNAVVGGDHLCLDDNNGNGYGQADVWHCDANTAFHSPLMWTIQTYGDDTSFLLWTSVGASCLQYVGNPATNGTPVELKNEPCDISDPSVRWSYWTDGTKWFLAPTTLTTNGGAFVYGSTAVVSIAGTPANGSLVQMWKSGANPDQQIYRIY